VRRDEAGPTGYEDRLSHVRAEPITQPSRVAETLVSVDRYYQRRVGREA